MRKVVLYELMSLDGAVDNPGEYFVGSEPDAPPAFDAVMEANERRVIESQDTVLMGRGLYDEWSRYWPESDVQPFADFINRVEKVVVTSTPLANAWNNARAVQGPIADVVRELRSMPGGDIGVHGSITLAQSLLAANLIDELELVVGPVLGTSGRRLFTSMPELWRLKLIRASSTPTGTLLLSYRTPSAI